jgi:hypothetical protein
MIACRKRCCDRQLENGATNRLFWEAGGGTGRMVETWVQHTTQICSSCITNTIEAWWLRGEKLMNRNSFNGNSMMIVDDCGGWNPDCTAVFDVPKK